MLTTKILFIVFKLTFWFQDECGIVFQTQNAGKIVGGSVAVGGSWPASALVYFNYKKQITIGTVSFVRSFSSMCGGKLLFN